MRSLFSGASPARLKGSNSRDSQDPAAEPKQRRSFTFMKYSPDRRSSASMKASREHARQIAMKLSMAGDDSEPFQPSFPPLASPPQQRQQQAENAFGFNPFGHENAAPPQEDFFAQAASRQQSFSRKNSQSSHRSNTSHSSAAAGFHRDNSFDDQSVANSSAYDMDFLPAVSAPQRRPGAKGKPPRFNKAPSSEASFAFSGLSHPSSTGPPKSMSTFPSNSSMQSSFTSSYHEQHEQQQQQQQQNTAMMSPPPSIVSSGSGLGSGAAARRRMRSQMRQSGTSVTSDGGSVEGTPPASPMSARRTTVPGSNGSVGSSHGGRNRLQSYTVQGGNNNIHWGQQSQQNSPSTSVRGAASVCSSANGSEFDLFDSNGEGGFTFDAFGLDANEIDREVQEAVNALAGSGNAHFAAFGPQPATRPSAQDTSTDEFAPQAWDSPQGSRRSTPDMEEEGDGFVDGFRISKPSPLPLVSVHHHQSPVSSEKSSSLSSITDQNAEGAPRRNVFKEKAGFVSSANRTLQRPSPAQPPKKAWKPSPGAVKLISPMQTESTPRQVRERHQEQQQQQQQHSRQMRSASTEEETKSYWNSQLNHIPSMPRLDESPQAQEQEPTRKSWQSGASKEQHLESEFENGQEEKKDDDASEDKDNHTATTAALTDVVSESQQTQSSPHPGKLQLAPLKKENLEQLEVQRQQQEDAEMPLSPQEHRRKELEELRSGSSRPTTIFKSAAQLHSIQHDASKKIAPQQQRALECNSQRTSFGSFKERLRSAVDHESHATKSESGCGTSSFTRQKMKLTNISSGAKTDIGTCQRQQASTAVNAVVNRMQSNIRVSSPTAQTAQSDVGQGSQPAFLGVKLRKASIPEGLDKIDSGIEQNKCDVGATSLYDEASVQHTPKSTYREHRELGLEEERQLPQLGREAIPSRSPRGYQSQSEKKNQRTWDQNAQTQQQLHQRSELARRQEQFQQRLQQQHEKEQEDYDGQAQLEEEPCRSDHAGATSQQPDEKLPSPRKLTYRERRELELQREEEERTRQEAAAKVSEEPERDVAELIRRRIAANKNKTASATYANEGESQPEFISRNRLRPTALPIDDRLKSATSGDSYGYDAPLDEVNTDQREQQRQKQQEQLPYQESQQQQHYFEDLQSGSPRHTRSFPKYTQQQNDSGDESPRDQQQKQTDADPIAGNLSALYSQLKQLKKQGSEDEPYPEPRQEQHHVQDMHAGPEDKAAPRRVQAMVDGKNPNLDVQIPPSNSQAADRAYSPSRTPKATVAMLNAFLHGRENINGEDECKPEEPPDETEDATSPGSPPKKTTAAVVNDGRPPLKQDAKYTRYFNMLKIGLPMEVVKHAMQRDGLDAAVMDGDHDKPASVGIPMKEDPKYSKYFKMLKIGMPMEAVKHAMERDGLDSHVMDQDHNLPADSSKGKKDDELKVKDSHRRARLHWKPVDKGKVRRGSLWAKIDEDQELNQIEIDEEEFAELFQAEIQPSAEPKVAKKKANSPKKGAAVRVIDPKRANNGGIILARLKMSHDDMADVVDRIDENSMTAEQIEHIIEFLPTNEERKALEAYMLEGGQDAAEKFDGLCECEKFMVSMMTVKHAKRKVRALLFKLQFESCLEALYSETHTVECSCDELSNSIRLRQLLGIVLTFGNRLNTAGKGGKKKKAGAFTLDSLLKLNQAKAFDKKTTFLQYIVLIVQRNNELLLRFKDDLPTVLKADKVFWDQCISDLEEVENQLENVRRIALYQARQAAKYRKKKNKHHREGEDDEESLSDLSLSLEEEVEALRSTPIGLFTLSAIKKVSYLRDRVEGTKSKFKRLLEYFGEDDKHMQPHELFNIIVKFCRDFDKAKEQAYADEKKKKRDERKRQSANYNGHTPNEKTPNGKPPTRQSSPGLLRASNMQPNASRVINDLRQLQSNNTPSRREDASSNYEKLGQSKHSTSYPYQESTQPQNGRQHDHQVSPDLSTYNVHQNRSSPRRNRSGSSPQNGQSNPNPQQYQGVLASPPRNGQINTYQRQQQPGPSPHYGQQPPSTSSRDCSQIQGYQNDNGNEDEAKILVALHEQGRVDNNAVQEHGLNTSVSSDAAQSELRRKARMRSANRRRALSPPDDQHVESHENKISILPDHSHYSSIESAYGRKSSEIGVNKNVNNTAPSCAGPEQNQPEISQASSSSNLMRSKLRNKRLMERKQKILGRNSPPPVTAATRTTN